MRITKLECFVHDMRLKSPYVIAYETISACSNVFIRAETDSGIEGAGCSAPDFTVTGETAMTVKNDFDTFIEPALTGTYITDFSAILDSLETDLLPHPASLALADMILYDLVSKNAGVPLYKYLGGVRTSIPTSVTLSIMPLYEFLKKAEEYMKEGFRIFKVKGGINVDEDIEKIIRLREQYGNSISIRFDANQGYDLRQSIEFEKGTKNASVEFIEQPVNRYDSVLLQKVTSVLDMPVMADECLMNYKDARNICCYHIADLINIKLMKVGGIRESIRINSVAKAHGIKAMTGCMDESALAIAAGLHFTLSQPNVEYADLDGHLDLLSDPYAGAVCIKNGVLYANEKAGLGWVAF